MPIRRFEPADVDELARLRVANRAFLEPFEPPRPESFFTPDGQAQWLAHANGLRLAIVDDDGAIAGAISLSQIVRGPLQSATVGYWVDEGRNGRGLAGRALAETVELAFGELALHRLEAGTLLDNAASQQVLRRNGFTEIGVARKHLLIGGTWRHHLLFERLADDEPVRADARSADEHLHAVARVYGPETWTVYDMLDESLEPRGPDVLLAVAGELLTPESVFLDVGCRDASHLIELTRMTGASGVGIDPVPRLVGRARAAVAEAELEARIEVVEGTVHQLPFADASFDLVWCRDVIELVTGLDAAIGEISRALRPGGHLIAYTVLATERLEPKEAALLAQNLAVVPANLGQKNVETAFARAGLEIVTKDVVGTEWREHAEERTRPASEELLRLARLRRQRERIVEHAGEEIYGHVESNLHWLTYHFLGKLLPTIYVLRKPE